MERTKKACLLLNFCAFSWEKEKEKDILRLVKELDIFRLKKEELQNLGGLTEKLADKIVKARDAKEFMREIEAIEKEKTEIISYFDPSYPAILRQISQPPLLLYAEGKKELLQKACLAVVGSRRASFYGLKTAENFAYRLASLGLVIVSGLAYGIDAAAAKGALAGGATIAVLGSGLRRVYPAAHIHLAEEIKKKGLLLSEFPLFAPPQRYNFPRRNRIVSGLSLGVLVVEAARRSGALITANFALEQGREVFCIPGPVNSPTSAGTNALIKEGAKLTESIGDILEELPLNLKTPNAPAPEIKLSSEERKIYNLIDAGGKDIDSLCLESEFDIMKLSRILLNLQLKGLVKEGRQKTFLRNT